MRQPSTPPPGSTRAGRWTRTSDVRFSTEWLDPGPNVAAEERATLCRLRLYVSDENACRFFDPTSNCACDHVTVPAVHLAEGLATDWWSIFGGRDREHRLRNYRTGFALPDVTLGFDGSTFEVRGDQFASGNPDVRFWQVGSEALSRAAAESTLASFIADVAGRLKIAGVSNSEVALRWSRVSRSLGCSSGRAAGGGPGSQEGRMIWSALIRTIVFRHGLPGRRPAGQRRS